MIMMNGDDRAGQVAAGTILRTRVNAMRLDQAVQILDARVR